MPNVEPFVATSVRPIFCSVNQAAEALGIAPYSMRELCRHEVVECVKHGGRWLVSVDDLNRYADDLRARGKSA